MPTHVLRAAAWAAAILPALAGAGPLSLDRALALAVQRSQSALAARAGLTGASEAARAAGQLPDPMLRAGVDNLPVTGADRLSTTRDSMTMKRIGISQEWLSRDKRAARQAAAGAMVDREADQVRAVLAETRLQTALAYLDVFYAAEASKLAVLMEHHAHEELEAARARLASATAGSPDVLALAAARGSAVDDADETLQLQGSATVALQRWVGVRPEAVEPAALPMPPSEQDYVARHPVVVTLRRDVEVARQNAAVAAGERQPNWTWEVAYGQRTGYSDMVSFGVSIPLQVDRDQRQDRAIAAKRAAIDKAEADLAEATRGATAEYQALAGDAQRLRERIDRYRSNVITAAEQRTAAATAAYRSNQAGLTTLFEARHAEVEAQRKLLTLQRDLAKAQAQLVFKPLAPGAQP